MAAGLALARLLGRRRCSPNLLAFRHRTIWSLLWHGRFSGHLERLQSLHNHVSTLCYYPVREGQSVPSPLLLTHHENARSHLGNVETVRVAVGRQENVVPILLHNSGEIGVEPDFGVSLVEMTGAEVLEPALRALHAVDSPIRPIRVPHRCALRLCDGEVSIDIDR